MFAALVLERDPVKVGDLPLELLYWCQSMGGFATFGWILYVLVNRLGLLRVDRDNAPSWLPLAFTCCVVCSGLSYGVSLLLIGMFSSKISPNRLLTQPGFWLAVGGGLGLLACLLPLLADVPRMRLRRIFAIAKLSFKEAVRRRVLYVFGMLLLVFLFASWFVPYKPEDQVRTYVSLVYYAMTPLLLFTAIILAAFSIPADVKNQTIHTILTKPVERFEVVLGRFLGYVALMTLVLFVMTGVSLLYVLRGVDPEAAEESLKARDPLYGDLVFKNTGNERKGDSVGREWEYRGYITYSPQKAQAAVWTFPAVSQSVAARDRVRCEFDFDIYRTTKGKENAAVKGSFVFTTWRFAEQARTDPLIVSKYTAARAAAEKKDRDAAAAAAKEGKSYTPRTQLDIDNEITAQFGYYQVESPIFDYHTQSLDIPAGLFRNAYADGKGGGQPDALMVQVTCMTSSQYVGMARYDLFLRLDDPDGRGDTLWFSVNFFKGALGLWFRLVLVIGLAVALSTYLSGVISMLVALLLYLGGLTKDFIKTVAEGSNVGGGPLESMYRLAQRQVPGAPIDATPTGLTVTKGDIVSRFLIRRLLDIIPDVDRFDLTAYVAEGFNISTDHLLVSLAQLAMYLLPWALLSYYLMKWREIASSN